MSAIEPFIDQRILAWADREPDRLALGDTDTESPISFGELSSRVQAVSDRLVSSGVTTGTLVPILSGNSVDLVIAMLAVMRAGGVAAPIAEPTRYTPPESQLVLAAPEHQSEGPFRSVPGLECIALRGKIEARAEPVERSPDDIAYLLHTSGSTGPAKQIRMRHQPLASWSASVSQQIGLGDDGAHCIPLPLAHSYPLWQMLSALAEGSLCWVVDGLRRPQPFFEILQGRGIESLCATPSLLRLLTNRYAELFRPSAASLASIYSNSEPMPYGLAKACLEAAPKARLILFYGLSEAPRTAASVIDAAAVSDWTGDVGRPFDGAQVSVTEVGEIVIEGPHLAADCAHPHATGDFGRLSADGELTVLGRLETRIRCKGALVAAETIETSLSECPSLLDAAAVALPGGEGYALVAVVTKAARSGELAAQVDRHLPEHLRPNHVIEVTRIARLPNGKIDRSALADFVRDGV